MSDSSDEWIALGDALACVLRTTSKHAQMQGGQSWLNDTAQGAHRFPCPAELGELLRRHRGVTVHPPVFSARKARRLEQKLGEPAETFQPELRDRRPLLSAEIDLVDAHMLLMRLIQKGRVRTRAVDCSAPLSALMDKEAGQCAGATFRELPPCQWSHQQGEDKRKRGRADASPIPDYGRNWLPPVVDLQLITQTEFRSIEVSAAELLAALPMTAGDEVVPGGIFRVVLTEQGSGLEIECLGQRAFVEPNVGFGAIGVLLSQPGVAVPWEHLDGAARAFAEGEEAKLAVLEGEAVSLGGQPSLTADDQGGADELDDDWGVVQERDADAQLNAVTARYVDHAVRRDSAEIARITR